LKEVLKPNDSVALFSIGFDGKLLLERSHNVDQAVSRLRTLEPSKEGTAFFDTVVKAAQTRSVNCSAAIHSSIRSTPAALQSGSIRSVCAATTE
jgi:hypothetical protein